MNKCVNNYGHCALAILGYNLKQSIRGLRQIVENNAENVVRYVITRNEAYAVFKDDSSLIAFILIPF